VLHSGRDSFASKEWLAADADARQPKDPTLGDGVNCDAPAAQRGARSR
jgi:competence protein ComEC